ncbi:MAG: hypothetical protein IJS15_16885 [Victivallales bacterium]|nr:hypothetical protein [Victivallales bacterium]
MDDIHETFLRKFWHDHGGVSSSRIASEYIRAFMEQLTSEAENALPVQNEEWKNKTEVTLEVAFGKNIGLAECQKQMRDLRVATHEKIGSMCRLEKQNAPKERVKYLFVKERANLWCHVLKRPRPSTQEIVEEVKKAIKQ